MKDEVRFQIIVVEMLNGIESKPVEYVKLPRVPRFQDQNRMQSLHTVAREKESA